MLFACSQCNFVCVGNVKPSIVNKIAHEAEKGERVVV
jgi:hypothetical protein